MFTIVVQTFQAISMITDFHEASPKQFWENLTVLFTILLWLGLAQSVHFDTKQCKFLELPRRVLSSFSLVVGVFTRLALIEFIHYNRLVGMES